MMTGTSAASGSPSSDDASRAPSLAEWLSARSDDELLTLLRTRPDLATPPPGDSSVLATRAGVRSSLVGACVNLDSFTLTVLDALVVLNADHTATTLERLSDFLGTEITEARVRRSVERLRERAIAWGEEDQLCLVPAGRAVASAYPGGLGKKSKSLTDTQASQAVDDLDDDERRLVSRLAEGPPIGQTKDADQAVEAERARTPVQRLLAKGLLLRRDANTVELPRQVALALRGSEPMGHVETEEPPVDLVEHGRDMVDSTAAGEVLELLRHTEALLESWGRQPPDVLRSGGVGVRDLRRTAKELDIAEARLALLVELTVAAGLVADSKDEDAQWIPTFHADTWLSVEPEQRWAQLAQAWLELRRLPALIGTRDDKGRPLGPLSAELTRPLVPESRRRVLEFLDEQPSGHGVAAPEGPVAALAWRAPRRGGQLRDDLVRWTLSEATTLGIVAFGALSTAGRVLLDDDPAEAARAMATALPEPLDHVLVQADLTVVAPGRLEQALASQMDLVADVESAGSATVYRVSESSVRRALDAGKSADALHGFFRDRSRTPIPQALTYLIDDVARRHGQLRAGTASAFLRCDDPVLVAEVLAHPSVGDLSLRQIAPTVLISPLPVVDVVGALQHAGFAPVAEGPDGEVLDLRPGALRIRGRDRRFGGSRIGSAASGSSLPTEDQLHVLVRTLRSGDRAAGVQRGSTVTPQRGRPSATETIKLLQEAADQRQRVWLGFVDAHGGATQRVVEPISVGGGVLQGVESVGGAPNNFPLHRITSVAVVEE